MDGDGLQIKPEIGWRFSPRQVPGVAVVQDVCFPGAGQSGVNGEPHMFDNLRVCCLAMAALVPQACSTLRAHDPPWVPGETPRVAKEKIAGAFRFPAENYVRITGKVKVLDSHTLAFDDGTRVELNGGMDGPELEQFGLVGDVLYPCGREAAEFLKKLIGDQPVVCYLESDR